MATRMSTPAEGELIARRERLSQAIAQSNQNAHLQELLQQVDAALERVSAGTYGRCETCHDPIEAAALAANPLLRYCLGDLPEEERRRLEEDLNLAARIQRNLLPQQDLREGRWEVHIHYQAAGPIGGDYCDLLKSDTGELYFLLGDAAGKGVAASMLAAQLHAMFRSLVAMALPVGELVERANRLFCQSVLEGKFATLICGRATRAGEVELVNAGHPAPLLLRAGGAEPLEATGMPLGLFPSGRYQAHRLALAPREAILLFTDGLSEARDRAQAEYGTARLRRLAAESHHLAAQALVRACLTDVAAFQAGTGRGDDVTLMALRRTE